MSFLLVKHKLINKGRQFTCTHQCCWGGERFFFGVNLFAQIPPFWAISWYNKLGISFLLYWKPCSFFLPCYCGVCVVTFQYRGKVCSLNFVFILGCSAQLNTCHLGDLNVVLSNNFPTFDPLAACLLLCTFFFFLTWYWLHPLQEFRDEGKVLMLNLYIPCSYRLEPISVSYSSGYRLLCVRITYLPNRSHNLIVYGALTLNLQRTKSFWSSIKKLNRIGWERKSEVIFIIKTVATPWLGLICHLSSGRTPFSWVTLPTSLFACLWSTSTRFSHTLFWFHKSNIKA